MPANKSAITILGDEEILRAVKRMGSEIQKGRVIKAAGRKSHAPMLKEIRTKYKSLGLRVSGEPTNDIWKQRAYKLIKTKTEGRGADSSIITGVIGREAAKAYWIEYGTTRKNRGTVEPRPFFRPAIMKTHRKSLDIMEEQMWEAIEKEWNRRP